MEWVGLLDTVHLLKTQNQIQNCNSHFLSHTDFHKIAFYHSNYQNPTLQRYDIT